MSIRERWRLVLGRYASRLDAGGLDAHRQRMDAALDFLYGREYSGRGLRGDGQASAPGPGTLDASMPRLVDWLGEVRTLFPRETSETIEKHALERYGLHELVTDPQTLQRLEPNQQLLRALLSLKSHMHGEILHVARGVIRQVVEEIRRELEREVRPALTGRLDRHRRSRMPVARNFDALGTLRRNLRNYDPEHRRLVVEELRFFERNSRRLPWDIILCIDQSGSMVDSVIHSAVMAGILAALPAFRVRLVLFDTSIVDLSGHVDDPVEVLMQVQLGGGTDIADAMRYCAQLVENPQRTVLVLVSDFCEGGSPGELVREVRQLAEARVRVLGLAALDGEAHPFYDRLMAEDLARNGMEIAALTPRRLAQWLARVVS